MNNRTHSIYCEHRPIFEAIRSRCERHGIDMQCLFYAPVSALGHDALLKAWHDNSLRELDTFYVHTDCEELMHMYDVHVHDLPATKVITNIVHEEEAIDNDDVDPSDPCNYEIIRPNFVADKAKFQANAQKVLCCFVDKKSYEKHRKCINHATLSSYASGWQWSVGRSNRNEITKCVNGQCKTVTHSDGDTEFVDFMDVENLLKWVNCKHASPLSTLLCKDDLQTTIAQCSKVYPICILFFADWCGHCTAFKETWDDAVVSCFDNTNHCCWIACNEKDDSVKSCLQQHGIRGFPTVQLHYNGRVMEMSGPRSLEALIAFSKSY
jgi:hypothetical protein